MLEGLVLTQVLQGRVNGYPLQPGFQRAFEPKLIDMAEYFYKRILQHVGSFVGVFYVAFTDSKQLPGKPLIEQPLRKSVLLPTAINKGSFVQHNTLVIQRLTSVAKGCKAEKKIVNRCL
jgi:hypothetical protein